MVHVFDGLVDVFVQPGSVLSTMISLDTAAVLNVKSAVCAVP